MSSELTVLVTFLLLISAAVCSGLNIAIMSLNLGELRRKAKLGNKQAKKVLPLRKNAHLTLAAILLSNVGFASATAIVLGDQLNGFVAGIISTLLLVVFGELLPQALFVRRALAFCAHFSKLLKIMIVITYPIAKPLQLVMDRLFGDGSDESTRLHSRRELGLMINEHLGKEVASELDEDEVEIIKGALQLSEKRVTDIMTPIKNVYWLEKGAVIDADKIGEIKSASRSRMPIFNSNLTACYGILLMKDLVDIDFDERSYTLDELTLHPTKMVGSRTALDTMFRRFIAARTHLIPVEKNDQIIGIITVEDLIEEIIGHELVDESDHANSRR